MPDTDGAVPPTEILEALHALARPRMTGTPGAEAVAEELRSRFQALGFRARELPFSFSAVPGTWGLPAAGLVTAGTAVLAALLLDGGMAAGALAVLALGGGMAALPLLLLEPGLARLPWARVETANLLFTRDEPRWIVMAHRDTKSQRASTLVRTVALVVGLVAWITLVALAITMIAPGGVDAGGRAPVWGAAGMLLAAAAVLILSPAGNRSPGALDNGTGLAALLALAPRVPRSVGFLVTDGEELGLAGARAAAGALPDAVVINLDGLDDVGPIRVAEHRAVDPEPTEAMARALLAAARRRGLAAVRRPLPPFVMVDHQPLAAAGTPALTVLKGQWRSLLRVHQARDTVDHLDGSGAAAVATVVAEALAAVAPDSDHTLRPHKGSGHSPAP